MDKTLFETDAVKVECISRLLRQADEMLTDVKTHLRDYGQRLGTDPTPDQQESSQIEIEHMKQAVLDKEEDARIARLERVQALDLVQSLRESLGTLQARIDGAETLKNPAASTATHLAPEAELAKQQVKTLQIENSRLTKEIDSLKRRLERAHEQNERLLRTREELLDTIKLSDVSVTKPLLENDFSESDSVLSAPALSPEEPKALTA